MDELFSRSSIQSWRSDRTRIEPAQEVGFHDAAYGVGDRGFGCNGDHAGWPASHRQVRAKRWSTALPRLFSGMRGAAHLFMARGPLPLHTDSLFHVLPAFSFDLGISLVAAGFAEANSPTAAFEETWRICISGHHRRISRGVRRKRQCGFLRVPR